MNRERVTVLFIAGIGRSGSTLLSRLLGSLEGFENLGEFASYWTKPDLYNRELPCGCGLDVNECPRWGSWSDTGIIQIPKAERRMSRNRAVFLPIAVNREARRRVGEELGRRYRRAATDFGTNVLVDASKHPGIAMLAGSSESVEVHLIHIVRDPRSVAASWSRPKKYLRRIPAWTVGPRWSAVNIAVERAARLIPPRVLIRYEDLVVNPVDEVRRLLDELRLQPRQLAQLGDGVFDVGVQHSLAGNPDKLAGTVVTIGPAERLRLGRRDAAAIALSTALVRGRYGYL